MTLDNRPGPLEILILRRNLAVTGLQPMATEFVWCTSSSSSEDFHAIDLPRVAGTEADPASAQADSCYRPKKKLRFDKELVRVAFKPWRLGFPLR